MSLSGFFPFYPIAQSFDETVDSQDSCLHCSEESSNKGERLFSKMDLTIHLAKKCKSRWDAQGCNEEEREKLMGGILYFCGSLPKNTHAMNRDLLDNYLNLPMLNTTFLFGWTRLNSDAKWPLCVVCSLSYPRHSYWEKSFFIRECNFISFSGR